VADDVVLVVAAEIALMTHVVLPWLTRRLARWISPRSTQV
jgi:antibiotic biosynthesis monooxygenase (ABM) superfamily enzyme